MMTKNDTSYDFVFAPELEGRETFIPLRHHDLMRMLQRRFAIRGEKQQKFEQLYDRLQSIFHAEHLSTLIGVEELYRPLDPDCELVKDPTLEEEDITVRTERLFDRLSDLLYAAHYKRISRNELLNAIQMSSQWGIKLDIDFETFDQLEVFARGYRLVDVSRRRWQNFYREETTKLPEFHRLILAFRLHEKNDLLGSMDTDVVYLKMFKNIPEKDLEILLPGTRVKLSPIDRGKILLPTISGAAPTAYKIYRTLLFVGVAATVANIWQLWGLVVLIGMMFGYIVKSVLAYLRTKDKYQFDLTRSLYVKNLDNNAGVLYRILNEAAEQELCETILGYTMLLCDSPTLGLTEEQLDAKAEQYLFDVTQQNVDFDLHDAIAKLSRLGLAHVDNQGRWTATDLDTATTSLNDSWKRLIRNRFGTDPMTGKSPLDDDLFTT